MSEPVCQLDDFHFTRLAVQWNDPSESGEIEINYSFDYSIGQHNTEKNRYRLAFRVGAKSDTPEPVGYHLDSEIVGFFRFPEATEQDRMDFLIRLNGCTILYGILRGQIANLTGVFPHRKLVLPTFMMKEVIDGIEKAKTDELPVKKDIPRPKKARSPKPKSSKA